MSDTYVQDALEAIAQTTLPDELEKIRIAYLGKSGKITDLMKQIGALSPDERKAFGAKINSMKEAVSQALDLKKTVLEAHALDVKLAGEREDVTLAPRTQTRGRIHPISQVIDEVITIFGQMGFTVAEGPNVEDDFHNFTALNIPANHPAREMQDTFYLKGVDAQGVPLVLRTHTSSVQIRTLESGKPPFRFIAPGRTYRSDYDATHTPMFHQMEALVIEPNIHMGHLKGTIVRFLKQFFETDQVETRFRANFFPFTEPSAEVDIGYKLDNGQIVIGQGNRFMEILGCGMIHPNVLRNVGLDPNEYQGFALGMGIERLAMLKYGISDLRTLYDSDIRWLSHYGFETLSIPDMIRGLGI